jgi:transcriptional regulator with XRE-family HTH domain
MAKTPLGELRRSHHLTLAQLAGRIHVALTTMHKYETGIIRPSEAVWKRLIGVLGEPARELWFAQGDLTPAELAEYRAHDDLR